MLPMFDDSQPYNWHLPNRPERAYIDEERLEPDLYPESVVRFPPRNSVWNREEDLAIPKLVGVSEPLDQLGWDLRNPDPEIAAAAEAAARAEAHELREELRTVGWAHLSQLRHAKLVWAQIQGWQ